MLTCAPFYASSYEIGSQYVFGPTVRPSVRQSTCLISGWSIHVNLTLSAHVFYVVNSYDYILKLDNVLISWFTEQRHNDGFKLNMMVLVS